MCLHTCMHMVPAHVYIQLYRGYLYIYTHIQTALHTLYIHMDSQHTCSSAQTYTQNQRRHLEHQHMSRYHYMCVTHISTSVQAQVHMYKHIYTHTHTRPILPFHMQSSIGVRASRHPHRGNSTYAYMHMDICAHIYTYYQHTCLHLIHPSTCTPRPETHTYITSICAQNHAHVHIHYCPALIHIEDYTPPPHTSTHVATCAKPPARTHPWPA